MKSARGFSIVELLVAIGVMAVLAAIGFSAMGPADEGERLRNGQKQVVSDLRKIQNMAYSGDLSSNTASTHIATFSGNQNPQQNISYKIDGTTIALPKNVGLLVKNPDPAGVSWPVQANSVSIYFYHPAKTKFTNFCLGFACFTQSDSTPFTNYGLVSSPIILRLVLINSNSTLEKCVTIEGSGTAVTRIYEDVCT